MGGRFFVAVHFFGDPIMSSRILVLTSLCFFLITSSLYGQENRAEPEKPLVGWLEQIKVIPPDLLIEAKLDTGADVSSSHAVDITPFPRDGLTWVRFTLSDRKGDQATLERPLVREITITRHGGRVDKRPVVKLEVCLGTILKKIEISLVDRTGLKFPFLIGRNFMAGSVILDPSLEFITIPSCEKRAEP